MSEENGVPLLPHVERRLNRTVEVLGLPPLSAWTLLVLVRLDLDPAAAEGEKQADPHKRGGVVSWQRLASGLTAEQGTIVDLERAVLWLADWSLLQIVGRSTSDPVVPGAAALRLTHWGRACIGLAPSVRPDEEPPLTDPSAWQILHSASREALLLTAAEDLGEEGWRPLAAPPSSADVDVAVGKVAESLCNRGCAVVDAFEIAEQRGDQPLRELIWRTRTARATRMMLVKDPAPIRDLSVSAGVTLRWAEAQVQTRRGAHVLDRRLTRELEARPGGNTADASGVPDSEIATPYRPDTTLDDLLLPDDVRWQLQQTLLHARYRLDELPERAHRVAGLGDGYRLLLSGLPGTGKSLTAEAVASELGRPLIKLDLSSVLSKWLGETEKLLAQVFDVAEASGAVLVLDEAESLFRQRDTGSGGSGALATGIAYLLTRLDRFGGVLLATTNRSRDIDEAFFRRFDDFLVLPIPDQPTRRALWERMLDPDADGFDVDLDLLAVRFAISGGLIRGAAVRAAAWARGMDRPLTTPVVLASLARELGKSDRSTSEVLAEPYRDEVSALLDGSPDATPESPGEGR